MSGLLRQVVDGFPQDCMARNCRREGCTAHLGNVPKPHQIVDMDKPSLGLQSRSHCDFIIFHEASSGVHAVALELKNSPNVGRAVNQLIGTAQYLQEMFPSPKILSEFRAVLVHGKGISRTLNRRLLRARLNFRGTQVTIERRRCNDQNTPLFS